MRLVAVATLVAAAALVPRTVQARWESARDSKPPAVLVGMTTDELFNEALDVCVQRALEQGPLNQDGEPTNPPPAGANEYLADIAHVVAAKHGGTVPIWMKQLLEAPSAKRCQEGLRTYAAGTEKPKKHKTPKPRQARHLDLPPWLAPR